MVTAYGVIQQKIREACPSGMCTAGLSFYVREAARAGFFQGLAGYSYNDTTGVLTTPYGSLAATDGVGYFSPGSSGYSVTVSGVINNYSPPVSACIKIAQEIQKAPNLYQLQIGMNMGHTTFPIDLATISTQCGGGWSYLEARYR